MSESITYNDLALSGESVTLYLRKSDGSLLNTGGDLMTESPAGTGRFVATLGESRTGLGALRANICLGAETADNAVGDGWLVEGSTVITDSAAAASSGGLTTEQAAQLDAIQASTALITAGKRITVSADVGQSITLKIGDDYIGARAKRIEINDADQSLYTLLRDNTLTAREFGFGAGGQRDLVTGTFSRDTITWTAASGSVPAFTTVYIECSVPITVMAQVGIYDLQITDATGKKFTPVSSQCTLSVDAKS
jgi:hypothetical protein